jgi:hypothetical protein
MYLGLVSSINRETFEYHPQERGRGPQLEQQLVSERVGLERLQPHHFRRFHPRHC